MCLDFSDIVYRCRRVAFGMYDIRYVWMCLIRNLLTLGCIIHSWPARLLSIQDVQILFSSKVKCP